MARIRDVIINQQHALAEQRNRDEANKEPSEYGEEGATNQDKLEGGGGFAGADSKKRRGVGLLSSYFPMMMTKSYQRNAPPGRCHSCNRAETPEWRRGPDGARTLCNACGLRSCSNSSIQNPSLTASRLCQIDPKNGHQTFTGWFSFATKGNRPITLGRSRSCSFPTEHVHCIHIRTYVWTQLLIRCLTFYSVHDRYDKELSSAKIVDIVLFTLGCLGIGLLKGTH